MNLIFASNYRKNDLNLQFLKAFSVFTSDDILVLC